MRVCIEPGCPRLTAGPRCPQHAQVSARNHGGVSRHRRGHGAGHDRARRAFQGLACALQLPGCTGVATSSDYILPLSAGGLPIDANRQPSCNHCQRAQGAILARAR